LSCSGPRPFDLIEPFSHGVPSPFLLVMGRQLLPAGPPFFVNTVASLEEVEDSYGKRRISLSAMLPPSARRLFFSSSEEIIDSPLFRAGTSSLSHQRPLSFGLRGPPSALRSRVRERNVFAVNFSFWRSRQDFSSSSDSLLHEGRDDPSQTGRSNFPPSFRLGR